MKLIVFGLLYLLWAVALADDPEDPSDEVDEDEIDDEDEIPGTEVIDHSQPWPIAFFYVEDPFVLSITRKLNWFEATAACAARDFTLVSIGSLTKQRQLYNTVIKSGLQYQMNEPVWTSGSNLANRAVWSWYSTGRPFTYRNFQDQNVYAEELCMAYNTLNGRWTAELCTAKRYFICECA
ncbi:galactose-specific lectin nattectin-like [Drosophila albomicans]|uniref:Galactose-specific lectin nattectin-like n=1 Tax=Drosophila albomicans TaxID=7291 RepID=A0A6P8X0I3_DROAB|nr:galactose-specific lectin nattectin-like [Drosophila albomicans]